MNADPDSRGWRRPPADARQRKLDVAAAFGLLGVSILSMVLTRAMGMISDPASPGLSIGLIAAVILPLAVRRVAPVPALAVVSVAFVLMGELSVPELTVSNIALFMAIYTVGAWETSRARALVARLVVVTGMGVWLLISLFRASTADIDFDGPGIGVLTPIAAFMLQQVLVNLLYFAGAWWFGDHAHSSARQRALTELRTRQLQDEQEKVARQSIAIERLRIARELHDAVAHHVSVMGVQAAAARSVLDSNPEAARDRLESVEESSRVAVAELYQLLGTLRDEEMPVATGPTASLDLNSLDLLVEDSIMAGLRVTLTRVGEPYGVPPLVGLNLYRIAQEALTNVLKHAGPGTQVRVHLRFGETAIELEVSDDGRGRPGPPPRGAGLGLLGMRERAASLGGQLEATARAGSGWVVRITVPLPLRSAA
ncbi:MAG: sensor histidine kinase [Cryobacterium sp.]|nr:sensor histidine kinase [Cryobacterium sp.]